MTEIILSKASMDAFLETAQRQLDLGHTHWHDYVGSIKFTAPFVDPAAPLSPNYSRAQLDIWKTVSGRADYDETTCEMNDNIAALTAITATYPFASRDHVEVGNYFFGVANIARNLGLPDGSKIVEFGVGFGHVTRLLSNMGYRVKAVDIEQRYLDLLQRFALPGAVTIETQLASFNNAEFEPGSIDGFVFFECFHHCLSHVALVERMSRALRPGGKIIFAAEPFYDDWFDFPWGVRLDGHAVWAIRCYGWMELGFRKSYIRDLLEKNQFGLIWSSIPEVGAYGEMLVATRA